MQNRIAYYILSLLYLNGKVRIPGIGRIAQLHNPATVDEGAATIVPPQTNNRFKHDKRNKSRLLERFVAYKTQTSRTRARREIAKFSNGIKSGIKNEGRIELKYLGTFAMDGDEVRFMPHEELLNPGHSALQSIPLPELLPIREEDPHALPDYTIPAMHSIPGEAEPEQEEPGSDLQTIPEPLVQTEPTNFLQEEKEEHIVIPEPTTYRSVATSPPLSSATSPPTQPQARRKRETPLLLPISALILLGLLVGAFLFYQSRMTNEDSLSAVDPTTTDTAEEPISTANESNDETGVINEESETKVALADSGSSGKNPVDRLDEPESDKTPEQEAPVESTQKDPESLVPATGDCLIVVGAFAVAGNVDRMVNRLHTMGYTTRIYPRGTLTQVGIPVHCNARDLKAVLSFLRTNVEQNAWVRKPG